MASSIKVVSLKQVMVDGQLVGPVAELIKGILSDAQFALEQYEAQLIATHDQDLAAQTATSDAKIAELTASLAEKTDELTAATAQLTTANAELVRLTPPTTSGIPASPAEGETTPSEKLAAAIRDVVSQ